MTLQTMRGKALRTQFKPVALRFASDCSGSTAIEYAIIAVLIGAGVVGVVSTLGDTVANLYQSVLDKFTG
jgi:Flp pilus assembly pilin Flp